MPLAPVMPRLPEIAFPAETASSLPSQHSALDVAASRDFRNLLIGHAGSTGDGSRTGQTGNAVTTSAAAGDVRVQPSEDSAAEIMAGPVAADSAKAAATTSHPEDSSEVQPDEIQTVQGKSAEAKSGAVTTLQRAKIEQSAKEKDSASEVSSPARNAASATAEIAGRTWTSSSVAALTKADTPAPPKAASKPGLAATSPSPFPVIERAAKDSSVALPEPVAGSAAAATALRLTAEVRGEEKNKAGAGRVPVSNPAPAPVHSRPAGERIAPAPDRIATTPGQNDVAALHPPKVSPEFLSDYREGTSSASKAVAAASGSSPLPSREGKKVAPAAHGEHAHDLPSPVASPPSMAQPTIAISPAAASGLTAGPPPAPASDLHSSVPAPGPVSGPLPGSKTASNPFKAPAAILGPAAILSDRASLAEAKAIQDGGLSPAADRGSAPSTADTNAVSSAALTVSNPERNEPGTANFHHEILSVSPVRAATVSHGGAGNTAATESAGSGFAANSNAGSGSNFAAAHAVSASPPSQSDPYRQLDQTAMSPASVLHAGASRMAVGVHDPAFGWVEINTRSAAGQVSAALVTASSASHAALAAQLPSLEQYLAEQQVKISHIGVEQQTSEGGRSAATQPDSGGNQTGAQGGEARGSSGGEPGVSPDIFNAPPGPSLRDPVSSASPWVEIEARPLSYISVRA